MKPSRDRAIALTHAQAIVVLMAACDIPVSARTAFEARVRQLQRLGVPGRAPDAGRARISYGIAELAALATAFRLMSAFLNPALAARYVTERWSDFAPFALAGARNALPAGYLLRRQLGNGTIALIEGNALADLGQKGRHDERNTGPLGSVTIVDADAAGIPSLLHGAGVVIDSRTYMPVLVTRVAEIAIATDVDLAEELDRLRFGADLRGRGD